ncbi:hypothetical protein RRSWK_05722 [Rhodopirellula sp. SWK7]|nr:hypothetical protein RRSWK_05722 [Rhodopirellula sp. SWK7]
MLLIADEFVHARGVSDVSRHQSKAKTIGSTFFAATVARRWTNFC